MAGVRPVVPLLVAVLVAGCGDRGSTAPATSAPATSAPVPSSTVPATTTLPSTSTVASTTPAAVVDRTWRVEALGVDVPCRGSRCPQDVIDDEGRIVRFDPTVPSIARVPDGVGLTLDASLLDAFLVMVGVDDVAYFAVTPPGSQDPVASLVAVATTGTRAGEVVAEGDSIDATGDSTLHASAAGLVEVGCCGHGARQPPADGHLGIGWVDPAGAPIGLLPVDTWLEYPTATGVDVVRSDGGVQRRWTLSDFVGGRDMPQLIATDDGGALLWSYDGLGDPSAPAVLYVLRPDGSVHRSVMTGYQWALLHHSGLVVVWDGEQYYRVVLG